MSPALNRPADTLVVLDFETTGLSPDQGDRAIEIGAVRLLNGSVADRFQALMNPGRRISGFIENYTGISNAMLADAPPCAEVMSEFAAFVGDDHLVAHNASFDSRFLEAEFARIGLPVGGTFVCSMLAARRLYPQAPNHKLGTLVAYKNLPTEGVYHRALADAEMTAQLWLQMLADLEQEHGLSRVPFAVMQQLTRTAKSSVAALLRREAQR
ncbi:3'-5' exonuclease [Motiliproteus sediminis]|uniref:3'-5' exonuclease n=1 Tax=Motiliproteus sediminis TaxID=1468178 RepID=UPI001AEFD906|nr:3'-5' exonuclease [Motiliproteus sediminis]